MGISLDGRKVGERVRVDPIMASFVLFAAMLFGAVVMGSCQVLENVRLGNQLRECQEQVQAEEQRRWASA
jgi:hypothetical protein